MKYFLGHRADNFSEAASLILDESGQKDMSPEIPRLFRLSMDEAELKPVADKIISNFIRNRYGNKARWNGKHWFVPIPQLRYDMTPVALITFIIQTNLVAAIVVKRLDDVRLVTLVETMEKPQKLYLPVSFLQGILDDELEQFRIAGRDKRQTGWSIPGLSNTLWLPDDFVDGLSDTFKTMSVASWLAGFGSNSRNIIPLVVGTLLGLLFADKVKPVSLSDRTWDEGTVIENLTRMFGSAVAKERFQKNSFRLKANMTNDDAIRAILSDGGNDGKSILTR